MATPSSNILAIFLGGPFHGLQRWLSKLPQEIVEMKDEAGTQKYRFAFGDDYIAIYYWKLNDYQVKAVRQQITVLRERYDAHE